MAGSRSQGENSRPNIEEDAPLTPRTKDIMQHFSRLLSQHSERIERVIDRTNNDLAAIATRVEQLERVSPPAAAPAAVGFVQPRRTPSIARSRSWAEEVEEEEMNNYNDDTETDGVNVHNDRNHRRLRHNRQGMGRNQREVRDHNDAVGKIKFTMPYFCWKI